MIGRSSLLDDWYVLPTRHHFPKKVGAPGLPVRSTRTRRGRELEVLHHGTLSVLGHRHHAPGHILQVRPGTAGFPVGHVEDGLHQHVLSSLQGPVLGHRSLHSLADCGVQPWQGTPPVWGCAPPRAHITRWDGTPSPYGKFHSGTQSGHVHGRPWREASPPYGYGRCARTPGSPRS